MKDNAASFLMIMYFRCIPSISVSAAGGGNQTLGSLCNREMKPRPFPDDGWLYCYQTAISLNYTMVDVLLHYLDPGTNYLS